MSDDLSTADRLRKQFGAIASADAAVQALLVEACRIADRLDHIHAFETGKSEWFEVLTFRMDTNDMATIHVSINGVIAEARQQANTLKSLVVELMKSKPAAASVPQPASNALDELAKRRESRKHA